MTKTGKKTTVFFIIQVIRSKGIVTCAIVWNYISPMSHQVSTSFILTLAPSPTRSDNLQSKASPHTHTHQPKAHQKTITSKVSTWRTFDTTTSLSRSGDAPSETPVSFLSHIFDRPPIFSRSAKHQRLGLDSLNLTHIQPSNAWFAMITGRSYKAPTPTKHSKTQNGPRMPKGKMSEHKCLNNYALPTFGASCHSVNHPQPLAAFVYRHWLDPPHLVKGSPPTLVLVCMCQACQHQATPRCYLSVCFALNRRAEVWKRIIIHAHSNHGGEGYRSS